MSLWDYIPLPPYEDGVPTFKLDLEEVVYLQQKQVILGDCVKGMWKINAAILIPIDASPWPPLKVPESALSIGALWFSGWTEVRAEKIFECWKYTSKPRDNCDDRDPSLIDYAISRVHARGDSSTPGMLGRLEARKEMMILGLRTLFQDEILDQGNINPGVYVNTMDLHDWIIDKVGKRYRLMITHLRYLKNYAATGVQAERRITDETLKEESFRFPFKAEELPENKFFEEAYESSKTAKASVEAADHLRHNTSVGVKSNEIRPYNYIPSDLGTSIEEALLTGDPNHVQGIDSAEEGRRTNEDGYIPGLRLSPYRQKVKTFWKALQSFRQDNGVGRKIVKTRKSS
ncbi:da130bcb-0ef6-4d16-ad71-9c81850c2456 [Sclerotinia trifoliorum]|uniref:Da130bcb-0ef6-4d16-ad71-9c81850c2456 n=1 Tax=Sclerotinia trifoliorum TaxID=28548 RepID=A0A8H2VX00_9HELO|nr:da130bcb-0ef6-4d16-ad71-9c81850c2456 [Sclerotinia trifoliorum]